MIRWHRHPKVSRLVVPAALFLMVLQLGHGALIASVFIDRPVAPAA